MDVFLKSVGAVAIAILVIFGMYLIVEKIHEAGAEEAHTEAQVKIDKLQAEIDRERMLVAAAVVLINSPELVEPKITKVRLCAERHEATWTFSKGNWNGVCNGFSSVPVRFDVDYGPEGDRTVQAPVIVDGP